MWRRRRRRRGWKKKEEGGWKKTRRGQHNDEKGILAGLRFQAALCKPVYFNSAATTIWFVTQSCSYFLPGRASYFHAFESHSRTPGASLSLLWRAQYFGFFSASFWFPQSLTLIPDSSCPFIIQSGKIFLETAFRWLQSAWRCWNIFAY